MKKIPIRKNSAGNQHRPIGGEWKLGDSLTIIPQKFDPDVAHHNKLGFDDVTGVMTS